MKKQARICDDTSLKTFGDVWADRLGLGIGSGWSIAYRYVVARNGEDVDENGMQLLGHNDCDWETKTSVITIFKRESNESGLDSVSGSEMFRVYDEETLIHELLHCKFPITYDKDNYESVLCASLQHQVLNDVARALFMAEYGLSARGYEILTRK